MSRRLLQRLGLFVAFLFALACCASVSQTEAPQTQSAARLTTGPKLRLVYCADSKGNYQPCPT